jgi:hypothetical protein
MAEIELPESWAGVAEPLRALIAEVERETREGRTSPSDLAAVLARWARVSAAIRAGAWWRPGRRRRSPRRRRGRA